MTQATSSMVTLVSATLVASTIFVTPGGGRTHTRSSWKLVQGQRREQREDLEPVTRRKLWRLHDLRDGFVARQEDEHGAGVLKLLRQRAHPR